MSTSSAIITRALFGTDGIRGVAGEPPLDAKTAHALGVALGSWGRKASKKEHLDGQAEVLIGTDTRESGPWLAAQVAGGLARSGVRARFAGVITTPGVAYLTRTGPFVAGVMISASHNPYHDNGLKVISHSGYKLADEVEFELEQLMAEWMAKGEEATPAQLRADPALDHLYTDYLAGTVQGPFRLRVAVDCANGSATEVAPRLFTQLGLAVDWMGAKPDGRNINLDCGSLHLDGLQARVRETGADLGIAFDGDADRALFVSSMSRIIDGDAVLFLAGSALKDAGKLAGDTVVATVMSNLGLEKALGARGIHMVRTPVGDKYVLEEMLRRGAVLGGEQSGHVIFSEYATTGDGILTALRVLEVVRDSGKSLDEWASEIQNYPQKLVNVRVKHKRPLSELKTVGEEIAAAEREFGSTGRVLVRFSGTEPLARVMIEAESEEQVAKWTARIADAIRAELEQRKVRRRDLLKTFGVAPAALVLGRSASQRFQPDWASLDARPMPAWYADAKFGIFIHWGVYSVPAFAPVGVKHETPYAEWYWHSLTEGKKATEPGQDGFATRAFHNRTFGGDFPYFDFAPMFRAELYQPDRWADLFQRAGARYVALTSKHHEGFTLWRNEQANRAYGRPWNSVDIGPKRDLLLDLMEAGRAKGLQMGIYYSLYEWYNPLWLSDKTRFVNEHLFPQFKDVVNHAKPAIIFSDGEWEMTSDKWRSPELLAWLFNESPVADSVVVDDRWGKDTRHKHGGYYTTEYTSGMQGARHAWEESRGMGFSYGYNRNETLKDYHTDRQLLMMLIDIVSRGGNLLLDIGPRADGQIPVVMEERLNQLGEWLRANGEAIYGTRMWTRPAQWSSGTVPHLEQSEFMSEYDITNLVDNPKAGYARVDAFFTAKGEVVYAILPRWPQDKLVLNDVVAGANAKVTLLETGAVLPLQPEGKRVTVQVSSDLEAATAPGVRPEAGRLQNSLDWKEESSWPAQTPPNGDGYAYNFDRRLDRINDTIVALTDSMAQMRDYMLDTHKLATIRHDQTMEEIRELIVLQKEHRIDIMALFYAGKEARERLDNLGSRSPEQS